MFSRTYFGHIHPKRSDRSRVACQMYLNENHSGFAGPGDEAMEHNSLLWNGPGACQGLPQ